MKVTMPTMYEDIYTVSEAKNARAVIKAAKDDGMTAKEYADRAIRHCRELRHVFAWEVLKVEATAEKHLALEWDRYGEGSGLFDVLLTITAQTTNGFVVLYAWVTDIWETSEENPYFDAICLERYERTTNH